jgi:hypothetical protein
VDAIFINLAPHARGAGGIAGVKLVRRVRSRPGMKLDGRLEGREVSTRPTRTDVAYDVWLSCDSGEFEAQIVNLSAMGFRLRSNAELKAGTQATLKVAKLPPVEVVIRWVLGDECGGAFVEPVIL